MGAPKGSTTAAFNVTPVGREILGDPKSGKSANQKGKGKNGGSNDTSSRSGRTTLLVPPVTGSHRGNSRSRNPSASNTPTSSPQTSPETKSRGIGGFFGLGGKGGSTDTPNTSPHTSPPQPQPSSLQGSSPPLARKPISQPTGEPNTTPAVVEAGPANKTLGPFSSENASAGLQDKQENAKLASAAPPTSDLPTPPASPETQNRTVPAALEDGPAPSLFGNPSGLAEPNDKKGDVKAAALPTSDLPTRPASPETQYQTVPAALEDGSAPSVLGSPSGVQDMDKQDNVKSAALLSSSPLTPPACPRTQNLAVQADLETGPASSNSLHENASGLAKLKDKQMMSSQSHFQAPTPLPHLLPPPCRRISRTVPARSRKRLTRQGHPGRRQVGCAAFFEELPLLSLTGFQVQTPPSHFLIPYLPHSVTAI